MISGRKKRGRACLLRRAASQHLYRPKLRVGSRGKAGVARVHVLRRQPLSTSCTYTHSHQSSLEFGVTLIRGRACLLRDTTSEPLYQPPLCTFSLGLVSTSAMALPHSTYCDESCRSCHAKTLGKLQHFSAEIVGLHRRCQLAEVGTSRARQHHMWHEGVPAKASLHVCDRRGSGSKPDWHWS